MATSTSIRTLLASMSVSLLLSGQGCSEEETPARPAPEVVFRELCDALRLQRQSAILERLGPQSQAAFQAMEGSALTLGAAWVPNAVDIRSLNRRTDDLGRIWLQVESHYGLVHEVLALESESGWTFELSLGTAPPDSVAPETGAQTPPDPTTDQAPPVVP
jgi:hypothetical protein